MLKQWPENEKQIVPFEDLISPVVDAVFNVYELKRKHEDGIPYDGYNIGKTSLAGSHDPQVLLEKDGLEYWAERGLTPMHLLLTVAFQLGMEQGIRLNKGGK